MKMEIKQQGNIAVEKLYFEGELTSDEKMLLVFLSYRVITRHQTEIDTEEIQQGYLGNVLETLFKLQLKGYVKMEGTTVILNFTKEGYKVCTRCTEEKNINEFGNVSASSDGKDYMCKNCRNSRNKQWREENPEHNKNYQKEVASPKRQQEIENERKVRVEKELASMMKNDVEITLPSLCLRLGMMEKTINDNEELYEIFASAKRKQEQIWKAHHQAKPKPAYVVDGRSGLIMGIEQKPIEEENYDFPEAVVKETAPSRNFDDMSTEEKVLHLFKTSNLKGKQIADYLGVSQSVVSIYKKKLEKKGLL